MTSGGQCVVTAGMPPMLQLSVNSWDMHTLEVSEEKLDSLHLSYVELCVFIQVEFHTAMLSLVLVLGPSTWMMLFALLQLLASYWSVLAGQS